MANTGMKGIMAGSKSLRKNVLEKDMAADRYYAGGFETKMSKREAMLILNLKNLEDKTTIKNNYKKILMGNHPDKGGSVYLSQKINEAKKVIEEYVSLDSEK
jgi:DnaJ family protein C protein 19